MGADKEFLEDNHDDSLNPEHLKMAKARLKIGAIGGRNALRGAVQPQERADDEPVADYEGSSDLLSNEATNNRNDNPELSKLSDEGTNETGVPGRNDQQTETF